MELKAWLELEFHWSLSHSARKLRSGCGTVLYWWWIWHVADFLRAVDAAHVAASTSCRTTPMYGGAGLPLCWRTTPR